MDSKVVRESSFRHMYANISKENWTNLKVNPRGGSSIIKANSSFFAVPWDIPGGALALFQLDKKERLKETPPIIRVFKFGI